MQPTEQLVGMSAIRQRRDFLALRGAKKVNMPGFLMLSGSSPTAASGDTAQVEARPEARLGLTVTKKIGGAVIRNRIRRRLRAAAREVFPQHAKAGRDYVLIARKAAYDRNYQALLDDLKRALLRLHPRP